MGEGEAKPKSLDLPLPLSYSCLSLAVPTRVSREVPLQVDAALISYRGHLRLVRPSQLLKRSPPLSHTCRLHVFKSYRHAIFYKSSLPHSSSGRDSQALRTSRFHSFRESTLSTLRRAQALFHRS